MHKLSVDEVWLDKMGNIIGRIGNGATKLVYDSHLTPSASAILMNGMGSLLVES
ncbi:MAG: hypothetical protein U0670_20695 [Anaerolineae bacterium]